MKINTVFYVITFVFLAILYSCAKQKNNSSEKTVNSQNVPPKVERDLKKYLKIKELQDYKNQTHPISFDKTTVEPFNKIVYNKVIAYDYEGMEEAYNSITTKTGNFVPVVVKQQYLNEKQIEKVISFLTNKKTYGEITAACFNPHLAIVFYNNNEIVFKTDICLDCNYQNSSIIIPAMEHKKIELENGDFYYATGFTKYGQDKIRSLCKEINFTYGN